MSWAILCSSHQALDICSFQEKCWFWFYPPTQRLQPFKGTQMGHYEMIFFFFFLVCILTKQHLTLLYFALFTDKNCEKWVPFWNLIKKMYKIFRRKLYKVHTHKRHSLAFADNHIFHKQGERRTSSEPIRVPLIGDHKWMYFPIG